jgi:hypothetical protein
MPMLDYFCKYCIFWEHRFTRPTGEIFGNCEQPTVNSLIQKDEKNQVDIEDGAFYTDQHFGCIYFRKQSLSITGDIIDETDDDEDD